jgi:hypothetical protein
MARKTVSVAKIVEMGNKILRSEFGDSEFRNGVKMMVENILHETDNYVGFRMLTQEEVPAGQLPGINYHDGMPLPYPQRFYNTDPTRVQFT